jgi:hypothetical protein
MFCSGSECEAHCKLSLTRGARISGLASSTANGSGKSARGGGERPSEKFPEGTRQARSAEYVRDNGPNPEDVDFLMPRQDAAGSLYRPMVMDSMFGLTEFESFAKMFDACGAGQRRVEEDGGKQS